MLFRGTSALSLSELNFVISFTMKALSTELDIELNNQTKKVFTVQILSLLLCFYVFFLWKYHTLLLISSYTHMVV